MRGARKRRNHAAEQRHQHVDADRPVDQSPRRNHPRQPAVENGEGKRQKLQCENRAEQPGRRDADVHAERRRHHEDRADAVDVEEIGDQKEHHVAVAPDLPRGGGQPPEPVQRRNLFSAPPLPHVAEERQREETPPGGGDEERDLHPRHRIASGEEHDSEAEEEGNESADVAPGVGDGREPVEAAARRDVHQQRVVEGVAPHVGDQTYEVEREHQRRIPRSGEAEADDGEESGRHEAAETAFASAAGVGHRAEPRSEDSGEKSGGGADQPPAAGRRRRIHADGGVVLVEHRREDGAHDEGECRIRHIVQDPADLRPRKFHAGTSPFRLSRSTRPESTGNRRRCRCRPSSGSPPRPPPERRPRSACARPPRDRGRRTG